MTEGAQSDRTSVRGRERTRRGSSRFALESVLYIVTWEASIFDKKFSHDQDLCLWHCPSE